MPRRKTQKRKQRNTKRNFKKRGGVGSKHRRSPSLSDGGPSRKRSRSTPYVTSTVPAFGSSSLTLGDFTPTPPFSPPQRLPKQMPALYRPDRPEGGEREERWLEGMRPAEALVNAQGMSHGPHGRHGQRSLSDRRHSKSNTRRKILPFKARLLMPTAGADDSGPMNQRLENLIKNIEETQIRMDNQQIPTADWEQYKIDNHPLTIDSVNRFLVNQEDKIRDFYNKEQQRQQHGRRVNKKIMNHMLKKTGKRTSLMTLGLLATLMANNLYKNNPEGIPPYQPAIAATSADIVRKATGNDGLIHIEEMNPSNPNYYIINTKSGKKIFFDPSTTTMSQWHEAKKKAILEQKPFTIYDEQDAVKFFLEQGNKDLLGIALKKISRDQKILLEQARLDQLIKEEKKQRRHNIRGKKTKYNTKNKRNNYNKHNTQRTWRGGKQ